MRVKPSTWGVDKQQSEHSHKRLWERELSTREHFSGAFLGTQERASQEAPEMSGPAFESSSRYHTLVRYCSTHGRGGSGGVGMAGSNGPAERVRVDAAQGEKRESPRGDTMTMVREEVVGQDPIGHSNT